jgi:hypothetical protein
MADYYPLISRAVGALDKKSKEARRALYDRALAFNPTLGAVHDKSNSELTMFVRSSLVELRCPCRDVGEVIPVGSLRPIRTAHKTLGGRTLERPSCGGFMPTAETTLIPAHGPKISLTSSARLDNEADCLSSSKNGFVLVRPEARVTSGGGFRPESCRLIW